MWFFKEGYWKVALMVSAVVSLLWLFVPHDNNKWLWGVEASTLSPIVIPEKVQFIPPRKDVVLVRTFEHASGGKTYPVEVWFQERERALYIIMFHPELKTTALMVSVAYEGLEPYVIWVNPKIAQMEQDMFPITPQSSNMPDSIRQKMYRDDI